MLTFERVKKLFKESIDESKDLNETLQRLANKIYEEEHKTGLRKALEQSRWIPIAERLPVCETEVLIYAERKYRFGKDNETMIKKVITTAFYEDGTKSEIDSTWTWYDLDFEKWDEENDCGIIPEGWWEYRHYNPDEVYNNLVDDKILAWMPLPEPYQAESEEV